MVNRLDGGAAPVKPTASSGLAFPANARPVSSSAGLAFPANAAPANGGNRNQSLGPVFPSYSAPAPNSLAPNKAGSGGAGGVGITSTGQVSNFAAPAAPMPQSQDDWWNQDANYQTESAGYNNSLQQALAALASQRAGYDTDFVQTLKNLGWNWGGANNNDLSSVDQGSWDPNNMLGAYGQGYNNLNNDFAGRNLLSSSYYGNALGNFNTDFNNQEKNLVGQRQQNVNDQTTAEQQARNEYANALTRAKQSSLARAAAQGIALQ